jgi:hypothetical protein
MERWLGSSGKDLKISSQQWLQWTMKYPTLHGKIERLKNQLRNLSRLPNPIYDEKWESEELREGHSRLLTDLRSLPPGGTKEFVPGSWEEGEEPLVNPPFYVGLEIHGNVDYLKASGFPGFGSRSGASDSAEKTECLVGVNDLLMTLGRFGVKLYVNGELRAPAQQSGSGLMGYLRVQVAGYRVRDSYDFEGDQPLGYWDNNGFRADSGGVRLNNQAFKNYQMKTGRGRNFYIFTDIVRFDLKALGLIERGPIPVYMSPPS